MSILAGLNNEAYHANRTHLSSSMLKLLLKDTPEFNKQWNLKQFPVEAENPNFTLGSYIHALCLEPDVVDSQYAIWNGPRKAGTAFQEFKAANSDKKIISAPQQDMAMQLKAALFSDVVAPMLISGGHAEFNLVGDICGVPVKARTDYINLEKGYIVDIKTTSTDPDNDSFDLSAADYKYDLSAALYCQIAEQVYMRDFDFYFIILYKKHGVCRVRKASEGMLRCGKRLVYQSLRLFKACQATNNWVLQSPPEIATIDYDVEEL